jgi:hypothetical protein
MYQYQEKLSKILEFELSSQEIQNLEIFSSNIDNNDIFINNKFRPYEDIIKLDNESSSFDEPNKYKRIVNQNTDSNDLNSSLKRNTKNVKNSSNEEKIEEKISLTEENQQKKKDTNAVKSI